MKADLHCHSSYSDGKYSVAELINQAEQKGLDYLSITDHDTFLGNKEAHQLKKKVKIIIGIELSTFHKGESVHILGFFKDWSRANFLASHIEVQTEERRKRAYLMIYNLEKMYGIKLNTDFVEKTKSITRGLIAREMVKQNFASSNTEVFEKYLGNKNPAYIPSTKFSTEDGIALIKKSGGLAVLAHPMNLYKSDASEIIPMGLDGIEAIYPHKKAEEAFYRALATKHKLFITAGSDFHYFNDPQHADIGEVVLEGEDLRVFLNCLNES